MDIARASDAFDEIVPCEYIEAAPVFFNNPHHHRRFGRIFTKYRVLGLERYEKVLLLDADLYVRANLDGLFTLQPPAAMARGPRKPQEGERMPRGTPVNAGVMLLRPSKAVLNQILDDITGPQPRRLSNYNSPDADYLTEHPPFAGHWTSIALNHNFQLDFNDLNPSRGTVRVSIAREAHFTEEGASLPAEALRVLHFSGEKPWSHLLEDTLSMQRLSAGGASEPGAGALRKALGEKLVAGLREYAQEVAALQGACSRLQLGEGTMWKETRSDQAALAVPLDAAVARLHAALPPGGRWFEGPRRHSVVWLPEHSVAPVAVYLEVVERKGKVAVGDTVSASAGGRSRCFEVVEMSEDGSTALLRRRVELDRDWQVFTHEEKHQPYYYHVREKRTQWEFPCLPEGWQALTDAASDVVYYHQVGTNQTLWDPPAVEEVWRPAAELALVAPGAGAAPEAAPLGGAAGGGAPQGLSPNVVATAWRRSFFTAADEVALQAMREALGSVERGLWN